jgi:hypothetical protein
MPKSHYRPVLDVDQYPIFDPDLNVDPDRSANPNHSVYPYLIVDSDLSAESGHSKPISQYPTKLGLCDQ